MAKLALLQFVTDPECANRRALLATLGMMMVEAEPRWPVFFDVIERERPDVIVIACGVIPQHAREAARYLGDGFNTRNIPVILVDVRPENLSATKASAPNAIIVDRPDLAAAVRAKLTAA
jgi:fructose-1-phosphate kinase PfkB-like protein